MGDKTIYIGGLNRSTSTCLNYILSKFGVIGCFSWVLCFSCVIYFKFFIQNFRRLKIFTPPKIQIPSNPIFKSHLPPRTNFKPFGIWDGLIPFADLAHKKFPQKATSKPPQKPAKNCLGEILPKHCTEIGAFRGHQWSIFSHPLCLF